MAGSFSGAASRSATWLGGRTRWCIWLVRLPAPWILTLSPNMVTTRTSMGSGRDGPRMTTPCLSCEMSMRCVEYHHRRTRDRGLPPCVCFLGVCRFGVCHLGAFTIACSHARLGAESWISGQ